MAIAAGQTIGLKLRRLFGKPRRKRLPAGSDPRRIEDLREPRPSACGRSLRQGGAGKETRLLDLPVRLALAEHREIANHIDRDMVAPRRSFVEEKAMKERRSAHRDASLLFEFALERIDAGFADLHTPAGKIPARDIAVPHQKDGIAAADHHAPHAER